MFLERWNIPPVTGGSMDQPFHWIDDIIRYLNLKDLIDDDDNPYYSVPSDAYEEMSYNSDEDEDIVRIDF